MVAWQMGMTSCSSASNTLDGALMGGCFVVLVEKGLYAPVEVLGGANGNNSVRVGETGENTHSGKPKCVSQESKGCEIWPALSSRPARKKILRGASYSLEFSNCARTAMIPSVGFGLPVVEIVKIGRKLSLRFERARKLIECP